MNDDNIMDNNDDSRNDANDQDDGADLDTVHHGEIVTADEADRALAVNGANEELAAIYAAYDPEEAEALRQAIDETRQIIASSAVETGRALLRVKELTRHGEFEKLVSLEFKSVSKKTAQNLMSLATAVNTATALFGDDGERKLLSHPQTVIYEVGQKSVPVDAQSDIIGGIVHDEYETDEDILEAVREAKAKAKAERKSKSGGSDGNGEGDGGSDEGPTETAAERRKRIADAKRTHSAFLLAASFINPAEDENGIEVPSADDVLSHYEEIGSGPKRKMTPEDHQLVSEMLFRVAQAHKKGGAAAVEKLKPVIPDELPAKGKAKAASKGKAKTDGGDD